MTFDGKEITYTRENAAEQDKKLPQMKSLSIAGVVSESGLEGLDGIDVTLVKGKRSVFVKADDWLETQGSKKDYTHTDAQIVCEGNTDEEIFKHYRRQVIGDTWKTNKGNTIEHFTGELANVHQADKHLEEPESIFEKMNNKFGWGVARLDMWFIMYNLMANYSTTWFKGNADFRLLDAAFKLQISEHIGGHFCDKEAHAEAKGVEAKATVGKSDVKPASVELGAVEGHEVGLTQNVTTVGVNSNI